MFPKCEWINEWLKSSFIRNKYRKGYKNENLIQFKSGSNPSKKERPGNRLWKVAVYFINLYVHKDRVHSIVAFTILTPIFVNYVKAQTLHLFLGPNQASIYSLNLTIFWVNVLLLSQKLFYCYHHNWWFCAI